MAIPNTYIRTCIHTYIHTYHSLSCLYLRGHVAHLLLMSVCGRFESLFGDHCMRVCACQCMYTGRQSDRQGGLRQLILISSFTYVCIRTHIYTYINTYIHTRTNTSKRSRIHEHTKTHTHKHKHMHTHILLTLSLSMHASYYIYIYMYIRERERETTHSLPSCPQLFCACLRLYIYIYIYTYTYIHTYINIYTHTNKYTSLTSCHLGLSLSVHVFETASSFAR
jgi:hypothetical protein